MKKRSKIKRAVRSNSSALGEDSKHFAIFMVILFLFLVIILAGVMIKGRFDNATAEASIRNGKFSVQDLEALPCNKAGALQYLFCN